MLETITSREGWNQLLDSLRAKRAAAEANAAKLREQKRDLALEAATSVGPSPARRKLDAVNAELRGEAFAIDDLDIALDQALTAAARQEQVDNEAAEQARQAELTRLTEAILRQAVAYTDAVRRVVVTATAIKLEVQNMICRATPAERAGLSELLHPGSYMRGAQACGLREVLDMPPYFGPAEHVVPLEQELTAHLSIWVPKEPTPPEDVVIHELMPDGETIITTVNGKKKKEAKNGK